MQINSAEIKKKLCGGNVYLRESPDGAQQLGGVANSGAPVIQSRGELGRLSKVMLLVLWGLVFNS